jgi:dihydrolipoamide dehydrogenase
MESIFGKTMYPSLAEWCDIIEDKLEEPGDDPIWNVAPPEVDDRPFDAIFLGGGGAGRFGAAFMRARGGRPLIIEKWPFLGGSCPHEACVPHHILSECAKELDRAKWFSGQLWFPEFDPKKVSILDCIELVKEGRAGAHALMNVQTKEQLDCEYVLNAWGNVIDKNTVEVGGRTFKCKNLVLATGVRTQIPDIPGTNMKGVYDFATLLSDLDYEPSRCVIIGGSKVAMEYGSFFQAAGVQTTILTRSPLMRTASLHHIDDDLRRYVIEMMELRGIEIIEGAEPAEILGNGRATGVAYRAPDGRDVTIETDFVFIATGERPTANTNAFIESLGVELDDRGFVVVNKRMETSVPGIYAVGDLIGPPMEQFKARHSGCCAARNIMGEDYEWDCEEYADFLHTTYEVVWTGLTEAEAREKYGRVIKIQLPPDGLPHENCAFPAGEGTMMFACRYPELTGFAKLVIAADSRKIVGAHYCGSGVKNVFQYLDHLIRRPEGITIDELGGFNELQVNDLFIQLCRLRAGQAVLQDL